MSRKLFLVLLFVSWVADRGDAQTVNETDTLVSAVSTFSQNLYQAITKNVANLVYSPFSTHTALTMAYLGAKGDTEHEMNSTLELMRLTDPHQAYYDLLYDLKDVTDVKVLIANGMWVNPTLSIVEKYKNDLVSLYNADVENINLNAVEGPEDSINKWVSNKTENHITTILEKGKITSATQVILINALFFNGTWKSTFNENLTKYDTFNLSNGSYVETDFMSQTSDFYLKLSAVENVDVIRIPFENERFAFYIALPKPSSGLRELNDIITKDNFDINILFTDMELKRVELEIPKFKLSATINWNRSLKELGMPIAFSTSADFSGITEDEIFISDVIHKATIEVTESGTVASAVTAVVFIEKAVIGEINQFKADNPFLFFIRDDVSKLILFQGKFSDPDITDTGKLV